MNADPIVMERTYNAPVSRVWQAITDKEEMKQWYFHIAEFKPEVGFEFSFYEPGEEKKFLHLCKIIEVVPGNKLTYSWRYDGHPGNSFVTFEISADGVKTKLTLTHEKLETFGDHPALAKENFIAGWTEILGKSLKDYVEK